MDVDSLIVPYSLGAYPFPLDMDEFGTSPINFTFPFVSTVLPRSVIALISLDTCPLDLVFPLDLACPLDSACPLCLSSKNSLKNGSCKL